MSQQQAPPDCEHAYPELGVFGSLTSTVIECVDLAVVERFYAQTLGLPVALRGEGWVMFGKPPGEIVLWQGSKSELVPGFMGAHVPTALQEAQRRGSDPTAVYEHPGGTHFYVADPEGTIIQIGDQ
jgi:catechol 2,3-dioxygenase-like lactoylglutathione lyase family enzyme